MSRLNEWIVSTASFPPPPEPVLALYAAEIELRARLYLGEHYDAWKADAEAFANENFYGDKSMFFPTEAWKRFWC